MRPLESVGDLHEGLVPGADRRTGEVSGVGRQLGRIQGLGGGVLIQLRDPELDHRRTDIDDIAIQQGFEAGPDVPGDTSNRKREAGFRSYLRQTVFQPHLQDPAVKPFQVDLDRTVGFRRANPEGGLIYGSLFMTGPVCDLEMNQHGQGCR